MRLKTKRRLEHGLTFAAITFCAPAVLAFALIAIVAQLHHNWWSAIPLMHYWTAYWLGVLTIGMGGGSGLLVWHTIDRHLR